MLRAVGLLLTLLTGFSGLVYEVVWQKYLAALLGSHSAATAVVLGLFLGGLAVGYELFGRVAARTRRPLLIYGLAELGIGAYALAFPWLFAGVRAVSAWLPHGPAPLLFAVDSLFTALLLGPPTVLMGGTIPLLTQALSRSVEDSTRLHAWVYGSNTAGAFAGALAAGYLLVPRYGLDATLVAMAAVNLAAGAIFALLGLARLGAAAGGSAGDGPAAAAPATGRALAAAAILAGFALMTLQASLNRIGALALGASQFTFSTLVAIFVLCIALGSFAVSALPRIPRAVLPVSQWLLVALLIGLYLWLPDAPYWAHWLRTRFSNDPANFYPFALAVFGTCLAVLCLPLALSGATLPLLFHQLRGDRGDLGRTAGRLYSWNTLGSLLGALLGGYALLYFLELNQVYWLAVLALSVAAALLTHELLPHGRVLAGAGLALSLLGLGMLPGWSPYKLSAGLFRSRTPLPHTEAGPEAFLEAHRAQRPGDYIVFYDDDPSASVAVFQYPDTSGVTVTAIINNGKSDGNVPGDYVTMGMAGLLPALLAQQAERAFVIGYGTGVTAGELASLESVREVTVAEISSGVIDAATYFEPFNGGAGRHPKTRILQSDAYRALLRSDGGFDVISSEPSNPWVTGVEMLFSREFLAAARERLNPGGVYAQWFHVYETDPETVALVLNTFRSVFDQVGVWYAQGADLLILGFRDEEPDLSLERLEARFARADYRAAFGRLQVDSLAELLAHELLPVGVLREAALPDDVHTIGHPILSHRAARAFFASQGLAPLPVAPTQRVREVGAANSLLRRYRLARGAEFSEDEWLGILSETCAYRASPCATLFARWLHEAPDSPALARALATARRLPVGRFLSPDTLEVIRALYAPEGTRNGSAGIGDAQRARFFEAYYHHAAPFAAAPPVSAHAQ